MTKTVRTRIITFGAGSLVALLLLVLVPAVNEAGSIGSASRRTDDGLDSLRRDRAYVSGQVRAAADGSMALFIDPSAGTVELAWSGIPIRRADIRGGRVAAAFSRVPADSVLFLRVLSRNGLIPTEPVRHVDAPADTAEAARAPAVIPIESDPSYVTVRLDNGSALRLDPSDAGFVDRLRGWTYRLLERSLDNLAIARDALMKRPPSRRGEIVLRIADADARAFYRALSDGSPVVIRSGS